MKNSLALLVPGTLCKFNMYNFYLCLSLSSGSYSPHEQLVYEVDCLPCNPGQFCNETGLSAVSGPCSAGFLCVGNATSATPNDGTNGPCPVGHYCPSGEFLD